MKKGVMFFGLLFAGSWLHVSSASAGESMGDAARKAQEIHELATSDVIYVQDELKALYYQNLQIIDLLKQIRDILDTKLENTKK
ncbi:MAG: hypothetical protein A3C47_03300 [Omnitrophica bacterium RIFCSPHIGHO2_02_FULL_51_18]|nr:MAG: hypothetical protein A3C47_03300 [Omnitrophica bacterium RIFCSPHIGHO2_02_FULL_51_18]